MTERPTAFYAKAHQVVRNMAKRLAPSSPTSSEQIVRRAAVEALEGRTMLSATYYVSMSGSDTNAGTSLNAPFRTIQRAANLVGPGDTVLIRGGTYRETVTPVRSGATGAPITFKPYNGEAVVVSGADRLTGWSDYQGSIYQAPQEWDLGFGANQVFVDGKMMIEARWPNTTLDLSNPKKATMDKASATSSSGTLYDADLTQSADAWKGAIIHMLPGQSWFAQTGTVTGSSNGKLTFSYKSMSYDEIPTAGDQYYLTGKFVGLDSAGEWFHDANTDQTYLWAPAGDNPDAHTVEVKRRDYAFDLRLRTNITIQGIDIFAATITSSRSSGNLTLDGIDAKYVGHFTVMPGRDQPWDTAILLEGSDNILENSRVMGAAGSGVVLDGSNSIVRNTIVTDTNYTAGSGAAILAQGSGHRILNNTVDRTGRDGIKIANSSSTKVLNNVVRNVMLQAMDGGAIYTFGTDGKGSEIAYNVISNVHSGGWKAAAIMLDNGSSNYVVHHNVAYDVDHGMKMNTVSRSNKVVNNTFLSDDAGIVGSKQRDFSGSIIKNNIFTVEPEIGGGASTAANLITSASSVGFVNLSGDDLRLKSNSQAVNAGVRVAPLTDDFAGTAPDIGAYEYAKAAFAAGANVSSSGQTPAPDPTPPSKPPAVKPPSTSSGGGTTTKPTTGGTGSTGGTTTSGGGSSSGSGGTTKPSSGGTTPTTSTGGTTPSTGGSTPSTSTDGGTAPSTPPSSSPSDEHVAGLGVSQVILTKTPVTMVGGQRGARGRVTVLLTNDGDHVVKSPATIKLLASADGVADTTLVEATRKVKLKPNATKKLTFKVRFVEPPADGDYHVVAAVSGAGVGSDDSAIASQMVRLERPSLELNAAAQQAPQSARVGRRGSAKLALKNDGNIALAEKYNVDLSLVSAANPGSPISLGTAENRGVKIKPSGSGALGVSFDLPDEADLAAGDYTLVATLSPAGQPAQMNAPVTVSVPLTVR